MPVSRTNVYFALTERGRGAAEGGIEAKHPLAGRVGLTGGSPRSRIRSSGTFRTTSRITR